MDKTGQRVPTVTIRPRHKNIQAAISINPCLLTMPSRDFLPGFPDRTTKTAKTRTKNISHKRGTPTPLFPKACRESIIPLLVRKVPRKQETRVRAIKNRLNLGRAFCLRPMIAVCMNAVAVSQGIREAFSTGSQAQYPPHPSSMYDHHAPRIIPAVRVIQAKRSQLRVIFIQWNSCPCSQEEKARQQGTLNPAYPINKRGGWNIIPGFCKRGFRPLPLPGTGSSRTKGLLGPVSMSRKKSWTREKKDQKNTRLRSSRDL